MQQLPTQISVGVQLRNITALKQSVKENLFDLLLFIMTGPSLSLTIHYKLLIAFSLWIIKQVIKKQCALCISFFFNFCIFAVCIVGLVPVALLFWWRGGWQFLWSGTMFPCHATPWPSAEHPASCGSHAPSVQPSQPLPDLLCSCPTPPLNAHAETPSPDPMESLIVVTEYEPSRPPGQAGEEEVKWVILRFIEWIP